MGPSQWAWGRGDEAAQPHRRTSALPGIRYQGPSWMVAGQTELMVRCAGEKREVRRHIAPTRNLEECVSL